MLSRCFKFDYFNLTPPQSKINYNKKVIYMLLIGGLFIAFFKYL